VNRLWKILVLAATTMLALTSCFIIPFGAYGYVTAGQLRTLEGLGLSVNEGWNPPDITGTYYCDMPELIGTNIEGDFPLGTGFNPLVITFYSQTDNGSVLVSYDQGVETGTGLDAFVSGSGNEFTVFAQITGTSTGTYGDIDFEDAMVFSGTMSAGGILNFEYGLMLTDKSYDPYPDLIEVGEARVFEEYDDLAANYFVASIHPSVQRPAGSAR
jgi:hypothetical protein